MARIARYDRQSALDKAVVLFWQKGYHNASIKQIEHALDMRPGSIYAAFGSKDGLFLEALACYAKASGDHLSGHLAKYPSVIEGLQDYLREIARACHPNGAAPSHIEILAFPMSSSWARIWRVFWTSIGYNLLFCMANYLIYGVLLKALVISRLIFLND